MAKLRVCALTLATTVAACAPGAGSIQSTSVMDQVAESYVRLVLAVGEHDADYVDAYYGPQEWRDEVTAEQLQLPAIASRADALIERLRAVEPPDQELERLRYTYLATQLGSLAARVDMLGGRRMTFDEESWALYDAVAPTNPGKYFLSILEELDGLLPPGGSIRERFGSFQSGSRCPLGPLHAAARVAEATGGSVGTFDPPSLGQSRSSRFTLITNPRFESSDHRSSTSVFRSSV